MHLMTLGGHFIRVLEHHEITFKPENGILKSAKENDSYAQDNLGIMYEMGHGVEVNFLKATVYPSYRSK